MQQDHFIEHYFQAANAHDIGNMLKYFATDAVVYDEGETYRGTEAIRDWIKGTNDKYNTCYTVLNVSLVKEEAVVVASVSGTFPGSPIQLTSRFTIKNGKIDTLKCGA